MGENSKIEWTDHTFNPWIGCTKVSTGCKFCYAETLMDTRYGRAKWGTNGTRVRTSAANWKQPLKWNRQAEKDGVRRRVFCASLADVFEDRAELVEWRTDLFKLIDATPHLDWLLLTKRPENIKRMWREINDRGWLDDRRHNVWLGTSVEDQATADERIPILAGTNGLCDVRFLSMEPLLGPVELSQVDPSWWVIVGGESGANARPMHPDWVRSIRDQCFERGCHFFFKQWGEYRPGLHPTLHTIHEKGIALAPDGRTYMTGPYPGRSYFMRRVGKDKAGRSLDGLKHNGIPYQHA
jgi:protein gp37